METGVQGFLSWVQWAALCMATLQPCSSLDSTEAGSFPMAQCQHARETPYNLQSLRVGWGGDQCVPTSPPAVTASSRFSTFSPLFHCCPGVCHSPEMDVGTQKG